MESDKKQELMFAVDRVRSEWNKAYRLSDKKRLQELTELIDSISDLIANYNVKIGAKK